MRLVQITPPSQEPLTLDEAKGHLRVGHEDDDTLIEAYLASARQYLDGPRGVLGRALVTQEWKAITAQLHGRDCLRLDLPPVQSVQKVEVRQNGAPVELDPATWRLAFDGETAFIEPAPGDVWPDMDRASDAVAVHFTTGVEPAEVPAPLKAAIRLLLGDLFENRETAIHREMRPHATVDALITPYRRFAA